MTRPIHDDLDMDMRMFMTYVWLEGNDKIDDKFSVTRRKWIS